MISKCRLSSILVLVVLAAVSGATPAVAQAPSGTGSSNSGASSMDGRDRPDWGGTDRVLHAVGASEFTPIDSATTYANVSGSQVGRYSTVSNGFFHATPHIPSGALLTYLELDYCDNSAVSDVYLALFHCNFRGYDCIAIGSMVSGVGSTGCSFVSTPIAYTVDNNTRRLLLAASTPSGASDNAIVGAYIGYKLQVSPAPASATFLDVPTGHPYFRFVEALVEAGITAGCGGANYCVDSPITRGEMAVFLSVALGLHFPN